jgi:hypothetical protein
VRPSRPARARGCANGAGKALQRHPGELALYVLTPTYELSADAGGVEAV